MNVNRNKLLVLAVTAMLGAGPQTRWAWAAAPLTADVPGGVQARADREDDAGAAKLPKRGLEDDRVGDGRSGGPLTGLLQTLGALALVVALIFLARYLLKRFGGAGRSPGRNEAIEVVARTAVAPRQQLMLVRLGERLVLVGTAGGGFSALCEITDPQEVAKLLKTAAESRQGAFAGVFKRKSEELARTVGTTEEARPTGGEAGVRAVAEKMRRRFSEQEDGE